MRISARQSALLDKQAQDSFPARVERHLLESYASAVAGLEPDELRRRVLACIAHGRATGFTWETALVGFAMLMVELGPGFDRQPAFARALAMRLPNENDRLTALFANTTDEDWEAAAALGGRWTPSAEPRQ